MEALTAFMAILVVIGLLDIAALLVGADSRPGFSNPRSPVTPNL
jgi:hypothetical protein